MVSRTPLSLGLSFPAVLSCPPSGPRSPHPHQCSTRALSRESLRSNQKGCPEISVSQEKFPCVVAGQGRLLKLEAGSNSIRCRDGRRAGGWRWLVVGVDETP